MCRLTGNNNRVDGYSYDAAGNLLNDGLNQYTYDKANRILSINNQATGYVYDAEGDRVAKLSSGGAVETVYVLTSGNAQLDELNGSGGWNHTNVYAPGGRLLATYDSSTQSSPGYHYNLTDWLGTKRMQTTAGGNQQETCLSNPFGDGLSCAGGADATEQHFTGKDHDTESNLDYFGARYYSETLGRFMTPDWAAAPAAVPYANYGDPQSLNLYAYVQNNPLTGIDTTGHCGGGVANTAANAQCATGWLEQDYELSEEAQEPQYTVMNDSLSDDPVPLGDGTPPPHAPGDDGLPIPGMPTCSGCDGIPIPWLHGGAGIPMIAAGPPGQRPPGANGLMKYLRQQADGGYPQQPADRPLIPGNDAAPTMEKLSPPTRLSRAVEFMQNALEPLAKIGSGMTKIGTDFIVGIGLQHIWERDEQELHLVGPQA